MQTDDTTPPDTHRSRRLRSSAPLVLGTLGLLGGGILAGASIASAAAPNPNPGPTASAPASPGSFDPTKGGHVGANGVVEKLLTGATADKARAAAQAAEPGATIQRVETDAEGAVYEAHMVKSDGSQVTVKMDASFKVTGIENGPNPPARNG
jgi:hypothetical protein